MGPCRRARRRQARCTDHRLRTQSSTRTSSAPRRRTLLQPWDLGARQHDHANGAGAIVTPSSALSSRAATSRRTLLGLFLPLGRLRVEVASQTTLPETCRECGHSTPAGCGDLREFGTWMQLHVLCRLGGDGLKRPLLSNGASFRRLAWPLLYTAAGRPARPPPRQHKADYFRQSTGIDPPEAQATHLSRWLWRTRRHGICELPLEFQPSS